VPVGVRTDKEMLDMDRIINATLEDDQHVWIVLKGDEIPPDIQKLPEPARDKV
jgi:hypothetical protein